LPCLKSSSLAIRENGSSLKRDILTPSRRPAQEAADCLISINARRIENSDCPSVAGISKSRLVMIKSGTHPRNSATRAARCGAALGLIFAATSVQAADAMNGERLAQRWCAACHVVAANQRQAYSDAPPFQEIAKRPNFSESGLTTFLLDPHAKMPNM